MDESSLEAKFSTTYYAILSGTYVDWRFQSENYQKTTGKNAGFLKGFA